MIFMRNRVIHLCVDHVSKFIFILKVVLISRLMSWEINTKPLYVS